MKITKYIFSPLVLSLLCACSDHSLIDTPDDAGMSPIVLSAAYPTASRASDDGFEDGDRMGIYVMDYQDGTRQEIDDNKVHAANVRFDFNGTDIRWTAVHPIYWTSKDTPADIIGYYPYSTDMSDPKAHPFSIARRQDTAGSDDEPGGYESSDFLWAKSEKVMPTASTVSLTFRHIMAGVRVTLKEGAGFAQGEWAGLDKAVIIPNIRPNTTVNLEDGTTGDAYGEKIPVSAYKYGEDWRAIVVPQRIGAGRNIVDISVDGIGYHLKKDTDTEYAAGKLNSFTIEVNKRNDGSGFDFVLTDESILPWIDEVDFRDGIVRNYMIVNVEKRGTLKAVVDSMGLIPANMMNVKITGEITDDDFTFLREECTALQSLNLYDATVWDADSENEIPYGALNGKALLRRVVFPKKLQKIGGGAFARSGLVGSLVLPEGLEEIGDPGPGWGCFEECKFTGGLSLPSTLKHIGFGAFKNTTFSGELIIPDGVREIGAQAFLLTKFTGDLIIPEGVTSIEESAFRQCSFRGKLELPHNLSSIGYYAFYGTPFSGVLSLPAGLKSIGYEAFAECGFSGELVLPASLETIGPKAFCGTKISGIVFNDGIMDIGEGAFMNCGFLRGSIKWPKKIQRVRDRMFSGCDQLGELILHEDVLILGGGILYGCNSLKSFICNSVEPPLVNDSDPIGLSFGYITYPSVGPFEGISLNNITLQVPHESVALYRQADGWKEFGRISVSSDFVCRPASACALNTEHRETLTIDCDGEWEVSEMPEWCSLSKTEGKNKLEVLLTIHKLPEGSGNREGKVVIRKKGTDITTECAVSQYDYRYPEDHCLTLQRATEGRGIDILFVGDGWDAESIAGGGYLDLVKEQMEAFFGVEPFKTYRDRFNVYACLTLSQDTGVNTTSTWRNTRFNTVYYHSTGTLTIEDIDQVFDYAVSFSPLTFQGMNQSLVIVALNNDEYGSVTMITEDGSAVSICSPGNGLMDTRAIVQHEACGHGFGKLADERVLMSRYLNDSERSEIQRSHFFGWYQNISLTGKMSEVHWSHLIFDPRYSDKVDIFEGAYGASRGVYRAEENSCMNSGIPYFSAISRQDMMRRIFEYSGFSFTMEDFYRTDSDKWGETSTSRAAFTDEGGGYPASAYHHPVRIIKSKKY